MAIEIGCGDPKVCKNCYQSNEIFIDPDLNIKPCHMRSYKIKLSEYVRKKEEKNILDAIFISRKFLKQSPGKSLKYWQQYNDD